MARSQRREDYVLSLYEDMDDCFGDVYTRLLTTVSEDGISSTLSNTVTAAITWQLSFVAGNKWHKLQDILDYPDRRLDVLDSLSYSEREDREQFESLLDLLYRLRRAVPARTYRILWLYGGMEGVDHTLASIGKLEGVTRERVRQLMERAADKLQPQNKSEAKIREAAWRARLERSAAGRILLEEFDAHCPLVDVV
jgi:hypothetical protein